MYVNSRWLALIIPGSRAKHKRAWILFISSSEEGPLREEEYESRIWDRGSEVSGVVGRNQREQIFLFLLKVDARHARKESLY